MLPLWECPQRPKEEVIQKVKEDPKVLSRRLILQLGQYSADKGLWDLFMRIATIREENWSGKQKERKYYKQRERN